MKQSKITLLTSVGAGLEYYDLVIYSLLANFISEQYFPSSNHVASLFATFGILALGNIIRPLGGVIFGIFGDRFGRKKIFAATLLWMAFVTFLMGLMPTFASWGLIATVLFSICRILQGLFFGAELPGAMTLLSEHIDSKQHGFYFGFMIAAVGIGVSLGSFITWMLTKNLTESQMLNWGFRVPFLLGGGLAFVGFFIRKHLPESPKFLKLEQTSIKLTTTIIKKHVGQIFRAIGILLLPASLITFKLVFQVYLHDYYHFEFVDIYLVMTIGYIWSTITLPFFGWVSDITSKKLLIIIAALMMLLLGFPCFHLLQIQSLWTLLGFIIFLETIIAIMAVSYFVLLPLSFQTIIRYTGTAFSYNIAYTIAALIPMAVNYIYGVLKNPSYLIWLFILLAILTIISTITLRVKYAE